VVACGANIAVASEAPQTREGTYTDPGGQDKSYERTTERKRVESMEGKSVYMPQIIPTSNHIIAVVDTGVDCDVMFGSVLLRRTNFAVLIKKLNM
jgi:hypothetical protein